MIMVRVCGYFCVDHVHLCLLAMTILMGCECSSNPLGWDSDLAALLLLVHLLPPTAKGKKMGKVSARDAADHVMKFVKVCSRHG